MKEYLDRQDEKILLYLSRIILNDNDIFCKVTVKDVLWRFVQISKMSSLCELGVKLKEFGRPCTSSSTELGVTLLIEERPRQ